MYICVSRDERDFPEGLPLVRKFVSIKLHAKFSENYDLEY